MTLAKKSKAEKEKVPPQKPKKTNNQRIGDEDKTNGVASKIEKKAVNAITPIVGKINLFISLFSSLILEVASKEQLLSLHSSRL